MLVTVVVDAASDPTGLLSAEDSDLSSSQRPLAQAEDTADTEQQQQQRQQD